MEDGAVVSLIRVPVCVCRCRWVRQSGVRFRVRGRERARIESEMAGIARDSREVWYRVFVVLLRYVLLVQSV